jgi:hypothetical protein
MAPAKKYLLRQAVHSAHERKAPPTIFIPGPLYNKGPPIQCVDDDVSAREKWVVAPCPGEGHIPAPWEVVVFRIGIKVGNFLDPLSCRVRRHRPEVKNAESQPIVALVGEAIFYILVVVYALPQAPVVAGLLGCLKRRNVPDVRDRIPVSAQACSVELIVLVVGYQELLPLRVENPALVGVGKALV